MTRPGDDQPNRLPRRRSPSPAERAHVRGHLAALYAADDDPWNYRRSTYEQRKYAETLARLPRRRYRRALEVGCSIGVFTAQLARHADRVLALDLVPRAIAVAQARRGSANVRFEQADLPREWPSGPFDLIVLSEVLYYWDEGEIADVFGRARRALTAGGDVLLVNWLGATGTKLGGDDAASAFVALAAGAGLDVATLRRRHYRIDVCRAHATDVAAATVSAARAPARR